MKKLFLIGLVSLGAPLLEGSEALLLAVEDLPIEQQVEHVFAGSLKMMLQLEPPQFDSMLPKLETFYASNTFDVDTVEVEDYLIPGRGTLGSQLDAATRLVNCPDYVRTHAKILAALVYYNRSRQVLHPYDFLRQHITASHNAPLSHTDDDDMSAYNSAHTLLRRFCNAVGYDFEKIQACQQAPDESTGDYTIRLLNEVFTTSRTAHNHLRDGYQGSGTPHLNALLAESAQSAFQNEYPQTRPQSTEIEGTFALDVPFVQASVDDDEEDRNSDRDQLRDQAHSQKRRRT